jgi:hypothetical protein
MNLIQRLFGKSQESAEVLCPHCERAMEAGHQCAGMSRRFFFGAMAGAAAGAAVLVTLPPPVVLAPAPQLALAGWEDIAMPNSVCGTYCITMAVSHHGRSLGTKKASSYNYDVWRAVKS